MFTRKIILRSDQVLLLRGPARIEAKDRGLSTMGIRVEPGKTVMVRRNRVLPFETDVATTEVQATFVNEGTLQLDAEKVGVHIWRDIVDRIFSTEEEVVKKVVIVGDSDSGKSTLTTFLLNCALNKGLKTGVVEGDVGQGDFTPPGSVGSAVIPRQLLDLRDLQAEFIYFIGKTSPVGVEDLVIHGVRKALNIIEKENMDLYLVNTDGYVREGGITYKTRLIERLAPDLVVYIRSVAGEELFKNLQLPGRSRLIEANRPLNVNKSFGERVERRLAQYRSFLNEGKKITVDLRRVSIGFLGNIYWQNELGNISVGGGDFLLAKSSDEGKILFIGAGPGNSVGFTRDIAKFSIHSLKGMFVALGIGNKIKGFGLIIKTLPNLKVSIRTSTNIFDTLFFSTIRLTNNLREESTLFSKRNELKA